MKEEAKLKAEELIRKFQTYASDPTIEYRERTAKNCALIAVDLKLENSIWADPSLVERKPDEYYWEETKEFWEEVKQQILAL